ncbi:MAG: sulfurtransferase complex subunit TusB [SAR86 cluster bacterium]|uniref:Sulfurtransferase complex subunit TusB n=1 Tax=SAR86 cluster bacterium TaxID=2030880 RepID=A0A2A5B412_9GAMM|nr:MAG: sulfurtransferase complex subunit TusB [SAR86 cluster bacterium]
MSILHTISRSPSSDLLKSCAGLLGEDDGILFIEDGIYYCADNSSLSEVATKVKLYALKEDIEARGMQSRSSADIDLIDYARFVEICCDYDKVVSWF